MDHDEAFDIAGFAAALRTAAIGHRVVYRESVGSTMDVARAEAAGGAPHGTLVLAEEQTAGRGRRGRGFHSPAGENLYFTLVLRVSPEVQRRLPVAVPLAVCLAVRAEGLDARIKWPNDIWVGERKLCGMLIDAETSSTDVLAYPGIGINVNGDPTVIPELRDSATSLRRELGANVRREELLARICNELEAAIAEDAAASVSRYRDLSLLLGRRVTVAPGHGEPFEGVAEEIDAAGALVVRHADGRLESVNAADVSVRPI